MVLVNYSSLLIPKTYIYIYSRNIFTTTETMLRLAVFISLRVLYFAEGFLYTPHFTKTTVSFSSTYDEDPGSPLFLTPYIESGKIDEAKELARVILPDLPDIESYAGYFTVDKTYDSNLFLWYFPSPNNNSNTPTIVWLQGGPGASSLFGLFEENGPISVKSNKFQEREFTWNAYANLVYIDSPVGTGFSFTNDSSGYCTNQTQIGEHLYSALHQFYTMFPDLLEANLVLSGESYAGKYVPTLAKTIHEKNLQSKVQETFVIPLKGMIIGNGFCDPINQLGYADYVYQIGLIDSNQRHEVEIVAEKTRELIKQEAWSEATSAFYSLMDRLTDSMGDISLYDATKVFRRTSDQRTNLSNANNIGNYVDLINTAKVRKAIHVGSLNFHETSFVVYNCLKEDFMKSVAPLISELLENYSLLIYNGQRDIIVAYPLTVNFLRNMNWTGRVKYETEDRLQLIIGYPNETIIDQLGFIKFTSDNYKLTEVLVRNSGHMAPADQPYWITQLIYFWYSIFELDLTDSEVMDANIYVSMLSNDNFDPFE